MIRDLKQHKKTTFSIILMEATEVAGQPRLLLTMDAMTSMMSVRNINVMSNYVSRNLVVKAGVVLVGS
jgi:hypothetical protein